MVKRVYYGQSTNYGHYWNCWGHGGRVLTLSPPTSEVGVWFPVLPQVGKLLVAGRWSQFTVQNLDKLLVSFVLPTTRRDMACTVLKMT